MSDESVGSGAVSAVPSALMAGVDDCPGGGGDVMPMFAIGPASEAPGDGLRVMFHGLQSDPLGGGRGETLRPPPPGTGIWNVGAGEGPRPYEGGVGWFSWLSSAWAIHIAI